MITDSFDSFGSVSSAGIGVTVSQFSSESAAGAVLLHVGGVVAGSAVDRVGVAVVHVDDVVARAAGDLVGARAGA